MTLILKSEKNKKLEWITILSAFAAFLGNFVSVWSRLLSNWFVLLIFNSFNTSVEHLIQQNIIYIRMFFLYYRSIILVSILLIRAKIKWWWNVKRLVEHQKIFENLIILQTAKLKRRILRLISLDINTNQCCGFLYTCVYATARVLQVACCHHIVQNCVRKETKRSKQTKSYSNTRAHVCCFSSHKTKLYAIASRRSFVFYLFCVYFNCIRSCVLHVFYVFSRFLSRSKRHEQSTVT